MSIQTDLQTSLARLARLRNIDLPPGWDKASEVADLTGEEGLAQFCSVSGWSEPSRPREDLRAHNFPILVYSHSNGWAVARKFEPGGYVSVQQGPHNAVWKLDDSQLFDVEFPTPPSQQKHLRSIDVFISAIAKRKHVLAIAGIATIVINLIALATSIYSMQVYDRVVPLGSFSTLTVLTAGALIALGFDLLLRVVRTNMLEEESVEIDTEVSEFFFARATEVRLDARPPSIGTMAAQLRGLEQVRSMMSSSTLFLLADLPFALLFIFIVAKLGGVIVTVMLVSFPVSLALAFFFARMIRADTARSQVSSNKKNGVLVEALDAAETIKSNRGHWFMMARWSALLDELHDSELPVKRRQAMAGSIFGTIQQTAYIFMIAWGAVEVFNHNMTMGALIACSILAGRINGPLIGQLPGLLVQWSYSRSSLDMLDGILKLPTDRPTDQDLLRPSSLAASIVVKDVSFHYPGAKAGITLPGLTISPGERIGVIGGIGSGKSTMLRLLAGLYAPAEGSVLMDKLDMRHVADDVLRQSIGYLPQDYRLINGSLRENLLLGLPDPGDKALLTAAEETGLSGLIASHPRGIDLPISEGGRGLSGGQRVLTGLTRLMLAQPALWLLDEPTANLDIDTEARVLQALAQKIRPDAAMVLVTHKIQLLNLVQRVILVANGSIILDGPTAEVLQRLQTPAKPQPVQNVGSDGVNQPVGEQK